VTPAEHVNRSEQLLNILRDHGGAWEDGAKVVTALEALTHATVAVAIELGAPHDAAAAAAAGGG
jgi:hypothetical protein